MIRVFKHPGFLFCCSLILLMMGTAFRNKMPNDVIFPLSAIAVVLLYAVFAWRIDDKETEEREKHKKREYDFVYKRVCEYAMGSHDDFGKDIKDRLRDKSDIHPFDLGDILKELALSAEEPTTIRASAACLLFYIFNPMFLDKECYRVAFSDNPMVRGHAASGWMLYEVENYGRPSDEWMRYVTLHFDDEDASGLLVDAEDLCKDEEIKAWIKEVACIVRKDQP